MSIITIQALVWSYAESILIIESQTAWVILSHKGYLEVNLTRNSYNKLKILSGKRKRTSEMRLFFKKKMLHYLWPMILIIFVLALLCPRRRFVIFRIIQRFFFFILFKIFFFSFKKVERIYGYYIPATFLLIWIFTKVQSNLNNTFWTILNWLKGMTFVSPSWNSKPFVI